MLQINNICKEYKTDKLIQKALDNVSLNFRDSEFVAILGPSGSGKTTLLNIIGGLDRYDSGDLIINGISTKRYNERDWDSYRNHTIGFVFQSYNLIPHQTVLSNVELALTISGISRSERRKRAKEALEKVGLGAQIHKKPNQMSGGQMQRVAIARALVNNPDILLADEPTGALDSETSIQVMNLLEEVAKERLVIMVTHNPELAEQYATRIVKLKDGNIISDTNPFSTIKKPYEKAIHKNMGKSSMSPFTAIALSFQNLRTKKARTFLTSFAGSIGIIGIALIIAISNGVNGYIKTMEEDTLSEYPLQIQSTGIDLTSMMMDMATGKNEEASKNTVGVTEMVTNFFSKTNTNDLASLKQWLGDNINQFAQYANSVEYKYSVTPQIFRIDGDCVRQVNPDKSFSALGTGSSSVSSMISGSMNANVFYELPSNPDMYTAQYNLMAGHWPQNYTECVLVLNSQGNISDLMQYTLGLSDSKELDKMIASFVAEEDIKIPDNNKTYSYEQLTDISFKLVNSIDYYEYNAAQGVWKEKTDNEDYMRELVRRGEDLKIVGVVKPSEGTSATMLHSGIWYTPDLINHIIESAKTGEIVKQQLEHRDIDVFTGEPFGSDNTQKELDMASLFKIDTDALREAFKIDESVFDLDMSDLANMDVNIPDLGAIINMDNMDMSDFFSLDDLQGNFVDMNNVNIEDVLNQINISISQENMEMIFNDILQGYLESIEGKPETDFSNFQQGFEEYLKSDNVAQQLQTDIEELVKNKIKVDISQERLMTDIAQLINQYEDYAKKNNITENDIESVRAFLEQPEIQQKISEEAEWLINESVTVDITREDIQEILNKNIWSGYLEYADAHGLANPQKLGIYFTEYLQSEAGQNILRNDMQKILESSQLEKQFADVISSVMQQSINTIMENMSQQLTQNMQRATDSMVQKITAQMQMALQEVMSQITTNMTLAMQNSMNKLIENMDKAFYIDADKFAEVIQMGIDKDELSELMMSLVSYKGATLDSNLKKLGYAQEDNPTEIDIYPKDFESKDKIVELLDLYNAQMKENGNDEQIINYTDMVGTLMSSVTQIVNVISYVLIAFVAISLVVSSIMIGIITYISVLERKKEIGILRAMGASKSNISTVFNAETGIVGMGAGILGIGITLILLIPGNMLIQHLTGIGNIHAMLTLLPMIVLIALSTVLTMLGGLIPSRTAANSDPVTALRNE